MLPLTHPGYRNWISISFSIAIKRPSCAPVRRPAQRHAWLMTGWPAAMRRRLPHFRRTSASRRRFEGTCVERCRRAAGTRARFTPTYQSVPQEVRHAQAASRSAEAARVHNNACVPGARARSRACLSEPSRCRMRRPTAGDRNSERRRHGEGRTGRRGIIAIATVIPAIVTRTQDAAYHRVVSRNIIATRPIIRPVLTRPPPWTRWCASGMMSLATT